MPDKKLKRYKITQVLVRTAEYDAESEHQISELLKYRAGIFAWQTVKKEVKDIEEVRDE